MHRAKTGEDVHEAYARDALVRGEILSPLESKPLEAALIELYGAPLLLVPVTLERKSARSDVRLRRFDDETRFNMTLLELLRQDFEISEAFTVR